MAGRVTERYTRASVAGLSVTLLNGLGVRAAYDRVFLTGNDLSTFGVGVFFSFDTGL